MSASAGPTERRWHAGRRLSVAVAGYAVAVVVWVLLQAPLDEPLLRLLAHAALVFAVLLAAALAASWWFLAAAIPILAVSVISADGILAWAIFGAVIAAPVVVGGLAAAIAAGRWARRRGVPAQTLAVATGGVICFALGIGALDAIRAPVDKHPDNPLIVDWRKGTYEGIALRSSTERLVAKLGRPQKRGTNESAEPIGEDYYDIGGPTAFRTPGRGETKNETLRYKRRAFFASDGRIAGWVTTSQRAETPEGVGVGDSRELIKQRYPQANCYTANEGSEYVTFPLCEIRAVCRGRLLAFGGDPIKSIWLIAETTTGWGPCRRPTQTNHHQPG
ncbi:MAG TPA: hypothetical protein VGR11_04190 [Solirubrobacteraceae bacterium]|nr:hypothetical protein [Solirubrobacteraceae bacterium]